AWSGKSYAIVNTDIRRHIEQGFAMYIYDFKFDDRSSIDYNHLLKHSAKYKVKPKFYVINFDDPRRSHRCNPLSPAFMTDISDAYEASYTIMLNLNRSWILKQGDLDRKSTRLNSSHVSISYAVFCLKKKNQ